MKLFAELYLDEHIPAVLAPLLRAHGFDVLTTQEAGKVQASDPEQLTFAVLQERAILTLNRQDFEDLHREYLAKGKHHWGILIGFTHQPRELLDDRLVLLDRLTADELIDQLIYL